MKSKNYYLVEFVKEYIDLFDVNDNTNILECIKENFERIYIAKHYPLTNWFNKNKDIYKPKVG